MLKTTSLKSLSFVTAIQLKRHWFLCLRFIQTLGQESFICFLVTPGANRETALVSK